MIGVSTAARWSGHHEADLVGAEDCCPLCASAVGFHHHLFWDCPRNLPPNGRPPDNPLQERFGWFTLGDNSIENHAVCDHMTRTASRILTLRHDGGAEGSLD